MLALSSTRSAAALVTRPHTGSHACRRTRAVQRIRAAYDVDVEPQQKTPNSGPGWSGGPPPPPPPPPPPTNNRFGLGNLRLPNGRDALIGLLGAGIGVAGMWLYYETAVPDITDDDFEFILAQEAIERAMAGDTEFLTALDAAISSTFPDDVLDSAAAAQQQLPPGK